MSNQPNPSNPPTRPADDPLPAMSGGRSANPPPERTVRQGGEDRGESSDVRWTIGDRIQDRWQIRDIKLGGMGIVYIVYDHEIRRLFAAKTFRDDVFSRNPGIAERFKREALAWIHLDAHENVVRARFVEQIENRPFLFLEYVRGGDLGDWISRPVIRYNFGREILRIAIQFCDGMIHAQSRGVEVHRDIKPQNCLVARTSPWLVRVTDFGLAKVFDGANLLEELESRGDAHDLRLGRTMTGMVAGTPAYMAPEQFNDAKHVNQRADIYSFGVMLLEMVNGKLPFAGPTWQDFERQHKNQHPPYCERVGWPFLHIIRTCLAKDPALRFASFTALRHELVKVYECCEQGFHGRSRKWKHKPEHLDGNALDAEDWANKGASLLALRRSDEGKDCFDHALELDLSSERIWSHERMGAKKFRKSKVAAGIALAYFDHALGAKPTDAKIWHRKAIALERVGRREAALACLDRALELAPGKPPVWHDKGIVLIRLGRFAEAVTCFERVLAANPADTNVWLLRASVLMKLKQVEDALGCYAQVLAIDSTDAKVWYRALRVSERAGRDAEYAFCLQGLGNIKPRKTADWHLKIWALMNLGRLEEALECLDEVLWKDFLAFYEWYNKGVVLEWLGRREDSIAAFDRFLEFARQDGGDRQKALFAEALRHKATLLMKLGRPDESMTCYERAVELEPHSSEAWCGRGFALAALGKNEEAIRSFDRALNLNGDYAEAWFGKGQCLANLHHSTRARACFEISELMDPLSREEYSNRVFGVVEFLQEPEGGQEFIVLTDDPEDWQKRHDLSVTVECDACGAQSYSGGNCFRCGAYQPLDPQREDQEMAVDEFLVSGIGPAIEELYDMYPSW